MNRGPLAWRVPISAGLSLAMVGSGLTGAPQTGAQYLLFLCHMGVTHKATHTNNNNIISDLLAVAIEFLTKR
eukprot:6052-Heterocapsa_arctica.AAC.1